MVRGPTRIRSPPQSSGLAVVSLRGRSFRRKDRRLGRLFTRYRFLRSRLGRRSRARRADDSRQLARARAEGRGMASSSLLWPSRFVDVPHCAGTRGARGSPDPRTLRDQLEDQLLDGDRARRRYCRSASWKAGSAVAGEGARLCRGAGFHRGCSGQARTRRLLGLAAAFGPFRLTGSATCGAGTGRGHAKHHRQRRPALPSVPLLSFPVAPTTRGVFQQVAEAARKRPHRLRSPPTWRDPACEQRGECSASPTTVASTP